jgi:uncharacterized damage-inducible protein DinB
MSTEHVAESFLAYSAARLGQLQGMIAACCDRLTEEQMWHRGAEHENSVANLLLHLSGNMRQWIMHGIDGESDVRERDAEFAISALHTGAQARGFFDATITRAASIIAAVPHARLVEVIDPQPTGPWRYPTILEAIYKVVGHVDHHAGQIIVLTKQMAAVDLDLSLPRKR